MWKMLKRDTVRKREEGMPSISPCHSFEEFLRQKRECGEDESAWTESFDATKQP